MRKKFLEWRNKNTFTVTFNRYPAPCLNFRTPLQAVNFLVFFCFNL